MDKLSYKSNLSRKWAHLWTNLVLQVSQVGAQPPNGVDFGCCALGLGQWVTGRFPIRSGMTKRMS